MTHIKPANIRTPQAFWAFLGRRITRQPGQLLAHVLRAPLPFLGMFIAAAAMQIALILTLGHAPADSLMPTTVAAPHGTCVMFCTHSEPGPDNLADGQPGGAAAIAHQTPAGATSTGTCWMFCSAPTGSGVLASASGTPSASTIPWRMDL
ncbi:hypothetical protein ACFXHA_43645 [Nocardia sp. NPDC059240]|uniref:hypothetical protein n=1 Tax=Nocardia sp. NPDC059240 TaxID=3346786 RepID=UPI0036C81869